MREHHQRAIERVKAKFENDPKCRALILGGSLAKGRESEDSDVDVLVIVTDEEYARRKISADFWYLDREVCDYPGGYAEGKYIDLKFLEDAADHGSEPARAAFVGASIIFSHIPGLEDLIQRIPVYQEQEQEEKMKSFYSQVLLLGWMIGEAEKREDAYLMTQAVGSLVLFGGRLILAHNKILYPYHKWFMYELKRAKEKPENFMEMIEDLLKSPTKVKALAFRDSLTAFRDWGVRYDEAVVRFMQDNEWNWHSQKPPLMDC